MKSPQLHSITPQQAAQLLHDNPKAVFIDVRSSMEFLFVGHPTGAINVAWIDEPDWEINPDFAKEVRKIAMGGISDNEQAEAVPVLLICRSGVRSLDAGKCLLEGGFSAIYNVLEGFEGALDEAHHRGTLGGWRFHGLPWEQC